MPCLLQGESDCKDHDALGRICVDGYRIDFVLKSEKPGSLSQQASFRGFGGPRPARTAPGALPYGETYTPTPLPSRLCYPTLQFRASQQELMFNFKREYDGTMYIGHCAMLNPGLRYYETASK